MAQPKRTTSYEDYKRKKRAEEEKKMRAGLERKSERAAGALPQKEIKEAKEPVSHSKLHKGESTSTMHKRAASAHEPTEREVQSRRQSYHAPRERRGGGIFHLIMGILVGLILVSLAFALPHFWKNRTAGQDTSTTDGENSEVVATLEDVVFPDEAERVAEDATDEDAEGQGDAATDGQDTDGAEGGDDATSTGDGSDAGGSSDAGSTSGQGNNAASDTTETTTTPAPAPDPTPTPAPTPAPTPQYGTWQLLYMNTEKFELDDEDDDVTEIEIKDVCKSIYKQNANVVSYCDETSKLRKTTAANLGKSRCEGDGGSCRYGRTCLLWNDKEDDNGDVKLYTAMYRCE